jgi:hypothetical protein
LTPTFRYLSSLTKQYKNKTNESFKTLIQFKISQVISLLLLLLLLLLLWRTRQRVLWSKFDAMWMKSLYWVGVSFVSKFIFILNFSRFCFFDVSIFLINGSRSTSFLNVRTQTTSVSQRKGS